jgi:hypothetical protein
VTAESQVLLPRAQEDRPKKKAKPEPGAGGTAASFLSALPPPKHHGGGDDGGGGGAVPLGGGLLGSGAGAGGTGLVCLSECLAVPRCACSGFVAGEAVQANFDPQCLCLQLCSQLLDFTTCNPSGFDCAAYPAKDSLATITICYVIV